ncbi:hypothetical protein AB0M54_38075 [Actinoplanes sp. NPDC051470]|uniref:LVIVD repeat-containing protein n=1 Tax=unclassified Actinoplanes TaxID=2626549 RepID=UPI00344233E6
MTHSAPRGRQLRRLAALSTATVVLSLLVAPFSAAAAESDTPGVDEIRSSPNLTQAANIPKQAPFNTTSALNSDWAFQGKYAYGGNYNGFTVYDISRPKQPTVAAVVVCPGSQNDISVQGKLLFLGTDSQRSDNSCNSTSVPADAPADARWEGVKIFDITNPVSPQYVAAVKTDCGSHTQTLIPGKAGDPNVYIYVQSYNLSRASVANCALPHDKISVIKVPKNNPAGARVVSTPILFPEGGNPAGNATSETTGCHDITAYPEKDIAAGACMGDGVLIDIADRANPKVITAVRDTENFAFWHSATFNNDATKVVFTDELGGGGGAECTEAVSSDHGADAIYDIVGSGANRKLKFRSYFKIPRINTATENCVAHNGSLIPVPGRDIMVQAWYQGGISVWDFTNSRNPKEIAYWERGPLSDTALQIGGSWSAYWYNGYIYSSDIQKGLDVLDLVDPKTDPAKNARTNRFNAQSQTSFSSW